MDKMSYKSGFYSRNAGLVDIIKNSLQHNELGKKVKEKIHFDYLTESHID